MKYFKTHSGRVYYKVNDNDGEWWYWSNKWIVSNAAWQRRYHMFVHKVSKLEVLVVLGPKSVKE